MNDSVFEMFEPHTEYVRAVTLTADNFDRVAAELSRNECYLVSKNLYCGKPQSITVSNVDSSVATVTCQLWQCFVYTAGPLMVMNRHDLLRKWRLVAADPYRSW